MLCFFPAFSNKMKGMWGGGKRVISIGGGAQFSSLKRMFFCVPILIWVDWELEKGSFEGSWDVLGWE